MISPISDWLAKGPTAPPSLSPEDRGEIFRERAAIREYDGNLPRAEAERLAQQDTDRIVRQGRS